MALRAWGRLVCLQMQNYESTPDRDNAINDELVNKKTKWKSNEEVQDYIDKSNRSSRWFEETDRKLYSMVKSLSSLTCHSHSTVRLELMDVCLGLIKHCTT